VVYCPGLQEKRLCARPSNGVQGIRYTIRARIERGEWTVSTRPADIESPRKVITGPRERAELVARSMIDRWYAGAAQSMTRRS
jgi:hypothetical protein